MRKFGVAFSPEILGFGRFREFAADAFTYVVRWGRPEEAGGAHSAPRPFAYIRPGLSKPWVRHLRTKPCTPRTNGKAECFVPTLPGEWAAPGPILSPVGEGNGSNPGSRHYGWRRSYPGIGGKPPIGKLKPAAW